MIFINPYSQLSFPSGVIASYQFNGNANDSVAGRNASVITDISYVSGKAGLSAQFNGSTSRISVPDSDIFSFTDGVNDKPFSISLMVYFDATTTAVFVGKRDVNNTNGEWQFEYFGVSLSFRLFTDSTNLTTNYKTISSSFSPSISQWYHLVFTYDGVNGKLYVNGVDQLATQYITGTYNKMVNTTSRISIGRPQYTGGNILNGKIDCLNFFNKELSQNEVSAIHAIHNINADYK